MNPNAVVITKYLAGFGLDARRILIEGTNRDEYLERQTHPDGRPMYEEGFRVVTEKKPWPEGVDVEYVFYLAGGGTPAGYVKAEPKTEPKVEEPKKEAPAPKPAPKAKTTKKAAE